MIPKLISILLLSLLSLSLGAQNYSYKKKYSARKNTVYMYWGYNRSIYSKSNIQFQGPGYSFVAYNVAASDRPSRQFSTYVNPRTITVPQFNARVGYYYADRWDVSFGYDHMKYVMRKNQTLYLNGYITSTTTSQLNGIYDQSSGKIPIREEDLHYENTNGLNYLSVQLNNTTPRYASKSKKFVVQQRLGVGLGPVLTQTDFNWNGYSYNSLYKITGYGLSLHSGVRFDFFNRFFFQSNWSGGFIHLPNNRTIQGATDFAKQKFVYGQWELVAGFMFYAKFKKGCDTCPDWH